MKGIIETKAQIFLNTKRYTPPTMQNSTVSYAQEKDFKNR